MWPPDQLDRVKQETHSSVAVTLLVSPQSRTNVEPVDRHRNDSITQQCRLKIGKQTLAEHRFIHSCHPVRHASH
jgi:hypothetical protein